MNRRTWTTSERARAQGRGWRPYAMATAAVGLVTAIGAPLVGHVDPVNIVMLFPLAVLFAATRLGRGPAVLAAFLSVALFDFYFVPPHFTFAVSDLQYLLTFVVLLVVALTTAGLAGGLRLQRDAAEERERRTRALYEMARELSAAVTVEAIVDVAGRYVRDSFGAQARVVLDEPDRVPRVPDGRAGDVTAPAHGAVRLPLGAPTAPRGTLTIETGSDPRLARDPPLGLIETFATLVAISLERVHYAGAAQQAQVDMAAERLRNSLLGALSHDLRTPLTALVGLADALPLAGPPLPPQQTEIAHGIRDEALRIGGLFDNLLEMARLQSGKVHLHREWQPLEDVVGASLQARRHVLAAHRLQLELPDDLPLVHVDAVLMERVFCNLIENAAKYTPPGGLVEIRARALDQVIEIVVADDGPGLPRGREQELFAKFSRGRSESAVPGVGLGLAIVETIVAAHGGRVRAENAAAGGARFVIELPRGEPPALPGDDA